MKTDNGKERIWPIVGAVAALFLVLVLRLWYLQIIKGDEYAKLAESNRLRIERIPAPRGIIFDRNGIPLVKNAAYYSVSLRPEMAAEADLRAMSAFLGITREDITKKIDSHTSPLLPIRLKEGLSFGEAVAIEAKLSNFPGLALEVEQARHYPYGEMGAHLIGYLGRLTPAQAEDPSYGGVPPQSFIGQWGVERLYDERLRGTPGKRVIEVDALGRQLRLLSEESPRKGEDIYLSMDFNLQMAAETAFANSAGALVALKPDTGEVLGLVSRPSFDPNLFSRGIDPQEWERLSQGEKHPLLNRALQSQYPPGSTFKIMTAIAALESGAMTPKDTFTCTGRLNSGPWSFGCWKSKGHGTISLHRAIVESCDVYFYRTGEKTGFDKVAEYSRRFGLGSTVGITLVRERAGLIPDSEWKKRTRGDSWYLGETYNASIGQGYVLVTPVQLARMMSAVANGGRLMNPQILRLDGPPTHVSEAGVSPETMALIKDALVGVVNEGGGTGWASKSKLVEVGGKTGTAQVISNKMRKELKSKGKWDPGKFEDHAWFVAFAPKENPELALSVFVEHGGHGGSAAAPIAKKAIEAYVASKTENAEDRQKTDN